MQASARGEEGGGLSPEVSSRFLGSQRSLEAGMHGGHRTRTRTEARGLVDSRKLRGRGRGKLQASEGVCGCVRESESRLHACPASGARRDPQLGQVWQRA